MLPGPVAAVQRLHEVVTIAAAPRPITDILEDLIVRLHWREDRANAREVAERWADRALALLRGKLGQLNQLGRPSLFCFNSSSDYMLQGAAFVERSDPTDVRVAKEKRARLSEYAAYINTITPQDFEYLCRGILQLFHVSDAVVTTFSADQGIDFYGRLILEKHIFAEDLFPTLQRQMNIWMVGQAKHYRSVVASTPDIRELVGAVTLARAKAFGGTSAHNFDRLNVRPCDPVFHLFFTTGHISEDGWLLLQNSGVVGMDGEMVAAFLADRIVGIAHGKFDAAAFGAWLKETRGSR